MNYVCTVPGTKKWDTPEQIESILTDLEKEKEKIVAIDFSGNSIGEKCAEAIGKKLKEIKNLRIINLSDSFVSRGSEELPKCLKFLLESIVDKEIKELDLSNNALGPIAAPGYEFFFEKNKSIEKLILANDGMGPVGTPSLMKILENNKEIPLRVLDLSRNKMETTGCNAVSNMIKGKKEIKEINISSNEISKEGMYKFFLAIKDNENLKFLDVQNNTLGNKVDVLLEVLPTLKNIEHLNISDLTFKTTTEIIEKINTTLLELKKLKEFYFEYNYCDIELDSDKEKIAFIKKQLDILLKIEGLRELILANNEIPKKLFNEYLPKFKKNGVVNFVCLGDEEEEEDVEDEELDMTDLNKKK